MRDYSRTIECNHEECLDLVAQLRATEGFSVLKPGMSIQNIYHKDLPGGREVGHFQKWHENRHLVIFSPEKLGVEMNPLEEFMVAYQLPEKPRE